MPDVLLLAMPHKRQFGKDADERINDCFPACIAMLADITVDNAAIITQADHPNQYVTIARGIQALRYYGIRSRYERPLTNDALRGYLAARQPVILLIKYAAVPSHLRGVPTFTGSHFILANGHDANGIFYHDPLQATGYSYLTDKQLERAMSAFDKFENLPYQAVVIEQEYHELEPAAIELITGQLPENGKPYPDGQTAQNIPEVTRDIRVRRLLYELGVDPARDDWLEMALAKVEKLKKLL